MAESNIPPTIYISDSDDEKVQDVVGVAVGVGEAAPKNTNVTGSSIISNSNRLTLMYDGIVYVFDGATEQKVQAVLRLLGESEFGKSIVRTEPQLGKLRFKTFEDVLRQPNIPAKRVASLIRFREKRKTRNFDKKIRYSIRKEVALGMKRYKGQFCGRAKPDDQNGASCSGVNPPPVPVDNVPADPIQCTHCGIDKKGTPAMRRGPQGPRSLCNACGLTWANRGTLRDISKSNKSGNITPVSRQNEYIN
ncbi:GATA transcription factor 24 [Zostera marina]|uniref:GATA transcription factor 24 n=1 Tax=Zostera marina TaxID=29655 RepID=A0A0K9P1Y8_ZOSMR|nr:GATA transcription factor 24 [Zostera marina]